MPINNKPATVQHVIDLYGLDTVTAITLATGLSFHAPSRAPAGLWSEAKELDLQRSLGNTGTTIGDMARFYLRQKLAEAEARLDSPVPVLPDEHFQS